MTTTSIVKVSINFTRGPFIGLPDSHSSFPQKILSNGFKTIDILGQCPSTLYRNVGKSIVDLNNDFRALLKNRHVIEIIRFLRDCGNYGSSPYRVGDFDMEVFKKEHINNKNKTENVVNFLANKSITENSTADQLTAAFNELIGIPNLIQLIDDNKAISEAVNGKADDATLVKNKQKLAEIYPLTLEKSRNYFEYQPKFNVPVPVDSGNYHSILNESFSPLVVSGDLSGIYKSKIGNIPEFLNAENFRVSESDPAQILSIDDAFIEETRLFFAGLGSEIAGTYFIVELGAAHLPGVAKLLTEMGVDCSFILPVKTVNRFKQTLKYYAKEYDEAKRRLESPVACASLIDIHRDDLFHPHVLDHSHFPTVDTLKNLGVKRVVHLIEARVGKMPRRYSSDMDPENYTRIIDTYKNKKNFLSLLEMYEAAGMSIEVYGVDRRQNR